MNVTEHEREALRVYDHIVSAIALAGVYGEATLRLILIELMRLESTLDPDEKPIVVAFKNFLQAQLEKE